MTTPPLRQRLFPLVVYGWVIGAIRYLLEFIAPDQAWYFGLYYYMPVAILFVGLSKKWGAVRWTQVAGTMVALAVLTWFVCNSIAYATGQFMEWEHGRFRTGTGASPIADTVSGKLWAGVSTAAGTTVIGTLWCVAWGTAAIWLPTKLGKKAG